jgi:chaperone required for assembly of F1-ATPase
MHPSVFSVKAENKGFIVCKNDKALETPLHSPLAVPARELAETIAQEFSEQREKIDLGKMPVTQMALTAIDITAPRLEEIIGGIMRYGETELICQRAADPAALVAEQNKVWQPYLAWCVERFSADLCTGCGIVPFEQNPEALQALRAFVEKLDAFSLTGLGEACNVLGSLVLGLALLEKRADAEAVFEAAELDRLWQSGKWGDDPVTQGHTLSIKRDLESCEKWFALLEGMTVR